MFKKFALLFILVFVVTGCKSQFVKTIYNFRLQEPEPITKDIKLALVLGGGGSRAIAQIGVIEVFEENKIPIDLIIGTSGGSVVGAIYADNPNSENLKRIGLNFKRKDIARISLKNAVEGSNSLKGGLDGSVGEKFIEENLKAKDFKDLKLPFIAVATDVVSGETVALRSGKIAPAVRASCAIPGLFSPVEIYGKILVDGGVTAPLGVAIAKSYDPKVIVAVDVSLPIKRQKVTNMFDLVTRSANLSYNSLNEFNGREADILIKPSLNDIGIFDDHKNHELYQAGRKAALAALPKVKKLLKSK